ncbi:nucleoside phosphorylase-I family protein [Helicobacter suis]|uniref:purine-nucleoside phosphorylase n=1 Tax=Helicobacter suis TaxID=104628 RepID=UPI0018F8286E|nr:purine-nucleoside phosphorylase [Helicobacter suis]
MFVCAGRDESFDFAKSIGIGLIESALNLSRLCLLEKPNLLIFIGTAGSYDLNIPLLSLYKSTSSTQIEQSFTLQDSYTPLENYLEVQEWEFDTWDLPSVVVNSSNYIHTNPIFSKHMHAAGIALENMEFFSVLSVARSYAIPSLGIFCTTNYTQKDAHQEFLKNHSQAKTRLQEWVQIHLL